ncbi:MAG: peptidoglycan DD-metalloendopeptidase family protein [Bacilli bacterium]|nr:peptidoglycan DD-metalloendopeptidase family protein [Bacilli bacterium]
MKNFKLIIILLVSLFIFTPTFNAANNNTLATFREKLATYRKEHNQATANANKTKSELNTAKNNVYNNQEEIKTNEKKVEEAKIEIETLNIEIAKKNEDIKKYMNVLQETMGNNIYLEYILDVNNYADLVYRYAIIEQVSAFDKEKITQYEEKIDKNKVLQVELAQRELALESQIAKLEKDIVSLGTEYNKLVEITLDVKEQLDSTQAYIDYLVSIGCKENQDITDCIGKHGDIGFIRPVPYGTVTSNYGPRTNPITGAKGTWHGALDIGGMKEGSNAYSAANGVVGKIIRKSRCGGNMVYVHHNIKGVKYTTAYYHLYQIKVSLGDVVTRNTVVGTVGGGWLTPWDGCSTGTHLHFVIAKGWYGTNCDYNCYISPTLFSQTKAVDPRNYIYFPQKYVWFNGR